MSNMALKPRPLPPVLLVGLVPVASWFIARSLLDPLPSLPALYACFGMSILAFLATIYLIPRLGPVFINAHLKGRDLLKIYNDPMCVNPHCYIYIFLCRSIPSPESMGLVCAAVYIIALMLFIPFAFSTSIMHRATTNQPLEGINVVDFPHYQVCAFMP